jgi:hypothetical protein
MCFPLCLDQFSGIQMHPVSSYSVFPLSSVQNVQIQLTAFLLYCPHTVEEKCKVNSGIFTLIKRDCLYNNNLTLSIFLR